MSGRLTLILAISSCMAASAVVQAQDYQQTPVQVSGDKVRANGKVYFSHVVRERQTLYSIAMAYGVTVDEICEANPGLNLKAEGPKKNQILLVPVSSAADASKSEAVTDISREGFPDVPENADAGKDTAVQEDRPSEQTTADGGPEEEEYFIHAVRWYEDINDISRKYGISVERIREFNGLSGNKLKRRMKLKIPRQEKPLAGVSVDETADAGEQVAAADTVAQGGNWIEGIKSLFTPRVKKNPVSVSLLMPLTSGSMPNSSGMDFYCGFLMAVKDLADDGIGTELNVFDVGSGSVQITPDAIRQSDMLIGPVKSSDIQKVLDLNDSGTPVISPLDPKACSIAMSHANFIQAPSSSDVQYEDLVKWIKSDLRAGDRVLVVSEKDASSGEIVRTVNSLLEENAVPYTTISYSILEGRGIVNTMAERMGTSGTTRAIIASDSEAFVYDVVRNLGLLVYMKHDVVLYGAAKIRSFSTIEVETLHTLNTHLSMSYNIDYGDPRVHSFLLEYRSLYGTEPTQFSFQGYDIASYFIRNCHENGSRWLMDLSSAKEECMLQADFVFAEEGDGCGLVNQGIRRSVYRPDFSIENVR